MLRVILLFVLLSQNTMEEHRLPCSTACIVESTVSLELTLARLRGGLGGNTESLCDNF